MDLETFRRNGYATIDWLVEYFNNIESYPVLSDVESGDIRSKLPHKPPLKGESFDVMLRDISDLILPGITHWQSPNFFAFFPANISPPAILLPSVYFIVISFLCGLLGCVSIIPRQRLHWFPTDSFGRSSDYW
ncbi:MAG: hypothetical protein IIB73_12165 [Proteobacteria bacterium]|nr:hypothetical protein [Pseudomonadota bacterium]